MSASIASLVSQALDNFDLGEQTVGSHVRRGVRIAMLRQDYVEQYGLQMELIDNAGRSLAARAPLVPIRDSIAAVVGIDEAEKLIRQRFSTYEHNRLMTHNGQLYVRSVDQIESQCQSMGADSSWHNAEVANYMNELESILAKVRQSVYDYLVTCEAQSKADLFASTVLGRGIEYLRSSLASYDPEALAMVSATEERLAADDSEALTHALTSIRRLIKAVADIVYPATDQVILGADKVERSMSDDAYRNRLIQFVIEKIGSHGQGSVVQKSIIAFGHRLVSLDELASKGVHSRVDIDEAESCVRGAYLLAIDILRIYDGTSPQLPGNSGALPPMPET